VTGLRCWLRGHAWCATITGGGRSVLVSCNHCTASPDLVPIANVAAAALPTRPAAEALYNLWSGQPITTPYRVDAAELMTLALVLLGVAVKPGEDPRRILDVLALAHLDPDRETR
jgi:hypothetical protein